ncbi:MAG TPA: hypothetical protein VFI20_06145 [Terracidiphilus sp.]|nr:hypothetical protein [Terracidiphilus sp.]
MLLVLAMVVEAAPSLAQSAQRAAGNIGQLTESGHITVGGVSTPYVIHRLPVSSFPELPEQVRQELNLRGCMIPQTYQAHRPENVIHASLEAVGTSDWAALCAAHGMVSLLVFFGRALDKPMQLASAQETERLQTRGGSGVLGFNWGIDPASPERVHDAQAGMEDRSPPNDHDALADSVIDRHTVFHYYTHYAWVLLETPE